MSSLSLPETLKPACLNINLAAVRENYRIVSRTIMPESRIAAVVKADSYGLGMAKIVPELIYEGCQEFFVATLDEAVSLRLQHPAVKIYVLNGFFKNHEKLYDSYQLIPVLNARDEIERFGALANMLGKTLPAVIHFDTGMNRLGLDANDAAALIARPEMLAGIDLALIMSHFACADEIGNDKTQQQYDAFLKIAGHYPKIHRSMANSAGTFQNRLFHFEMVRPGMALYGLNPMPSEKNPMKPVVSLRAPVLQLKTAMPGETIGYGATYRFESKANIAIVSVGYADGFLRSLSNQGALYWKGYRCDIRGRVSMDLVAVELSELPEHDRPGVGDFMEVIGANQSADDLAHDAGTLGYEIICDLGRRYQLVYENASNDIAAASIV
jgi:alanine racemase